MKRKRGKRLTPTERLRRIAAIIEVVDHRCMCVDGPASRTREEITDHEMRLIYELARGKLPVGMPAWYYDRQPAPGGAGKE